MPRWKLNEKTFKVRDEDVTVRQLTAAERTEFFLKNRETPGQGPKLLVSMSLVNPKMTPEEAGQEPEDCISLIAEEAMRLSNMEPDVPKSESQKESSASNT